MPSRRRAILEALLVALANLVAVLAYSGLGPADLRIPFAYDGDALHYQMIMKAIIDNGWFFENARLGAPFGNVHLDFPVPDMGTLFAIKAASLVVTDPALMFNLVFLSGLFLVPLSGYLAARMLGVPGPACAVLATAFNLLPFHFLRTAHLFYTLYFTIPVYVYVALRLLDGRAGVGRGFALRAAAIAAASTLGLYYAVFGFSLLVFAAAYRWKDDRKTALEAAGLAGIVVATLLVCLSPNIVHRLQFGTNLEVAKRDAVESEVYALRGTLLTIPFPEHRIPAFARAGERFHGRAPFVNENRTSWLGTFGAIGFALSILAALGLAFRGEAGAAIRRASRANLFLFLLGTMGGIGALFNYLVWPQIRAYNRVSVFIAFLSLLVLAMAIFSRWEGAARTRGAWPWIVGAVMSLVVAADLVWTPSPGQWVQANRPRYLAHQAFAQGLEKDLPPAAMVFQLPHQRFPEGPAVHRAGSHDGFYPYLHTSALRFSYGAMKSRPEADWQDRIALRPPAELAAALQEYGFAAILLDRRGYPDRGLAIRSELVSKGWGVMRESEDYIAFRLSPPAVPRQAVLDSFQLRPVSGFHGAERWGEATGYWCEESCVLELDRARWPRGGEPVARPSVVEFSIAAYGTRTVTMSVDGELSTVLSPGQAESVVRLNVSPALDKVVLKFGTDTPGAVPAGDPRKLAYRVYDLRAR